MNTLRSIGSALLIVGVIVFLFVSIFYGVVMVLAGLLVYFIGRKRELVVLPAQSAPQPQNRATSVQKEVAGVKCKYCGALNAQGSLKCQSCGASLG